MSVHTHPAGDELLGEIDTLKTVLSTVRRLSMAKDEKATQIGIITEEKQRVIDELKRQVN